MKDYFNTVETVSLDNSMRYKDSEELMERLYHRYPGNKKYIEENDTLIRQYFEGLFEENEMVLVENTSSFWRCIK